MERDNFTFGDNERVPYEMVYIELELKPNLDHDQRRLAYEDLQEVIVCSLDSDYWVVDEFRHIDGIDQLVYVLCESDHSYVLMADNNWSIALAVYPKANASLNSFFDIRPPADRLFTCLYVQYHYLLRRRAGPSSSLAYEPRNGNLQIIEGGMDGNRPGASKIQ
jgi:hypothetical protein